MAADSDDAPRAEALALRASQGDDQSIEAVLVSYLPRLRAFIRSQIDAEQLLRESVSDLVQSTCREVLQAGPDFAWQGEARFRGWLFTAALNKIRGRLRSQRARKRSPGKQREDLDGDAVVDSWAASHTPSRVAADQEANASLEQAMATLSPDHREVIALCRLAELPHAEVARIMNRTEGAVRTLLSRALCELVAAVDRIEKRTPRA